MLGLPKATELSRQLPKKAIYAKFNMNTAAKNRFDADISRITIVNEISPSTVAIAAGEEVKSFYVLLVALKHKDYDDRIIGQLSRLIEQNMLFVLECGDEAKLAIYHNKVMSTDWSAKENLSVSLKGLNLDAVWQNVIVQIGEIQIEQGKTLDEQIAIDEKRAKLQKEINKLERLARAEKQPKKKFELVTKLRNYQREMEVLLNGQKSD